MARHSAIDLIRGLDLDDIRQQITDRETELETLIAEKRKEIDALRILEKAADFMVNGKPARVKHEKPERNGKAHQDNGHQENGEYQQSDEKNRLAISDFLMQAEGQAAPVGDIADGLGVPVSAVRRLLIHEWFMKKGAGRGTVYANANVKE
jgi:hypothetical protein